MVGFIMMCKKKRKTNIKPLLHFYIFNWSSIVAKKGRHCKQKIAEIKKGTDNHMPCVALKVIYYISANCHENIVCCCKISVNLASNFIHHIINLWQFQNFLKRAQISFGAVINDVITNLLKFIAESKQAIFTLITFRKTFLGGCALLELLTNESFM
jgi:hypothetical protein